MLTMQRLKSAREIGIGSGSELWVAPMNPPEPILHNDVERHMLAAIFIGDVQQFSSALVPVLRLKKAISPFAEEWHMAGHGSVLVNDLVDFRAVNKVVI